MANLRSLTALLLLACLPILCFSCFPVRCDGDRSSLVLELTDATFDAAISNHDYILVDFYTPWCGHCKRLSPELDAAAPGLAEKIPPIIVAKVNVEKNAKTASRYDVRAYPTLKFFIKGFPVDYKGPRKAQALSSHLYKLSRPDLEVLTNEAELETFMQSYESDFPVFVVFGTQESAIASHLAKQYKSKAWFLVVEQFSEKSMQRFGFNEAPVIVALSVRGDVEVYYGPFEGGNSDEASRFIQLNLLPLVNEITTDSLRTLHEHDDGRAIALAILRDDSSTQSESLIRLLRDLAPNNRDFIFAHVDSDKFLSFVDTFHIDNSSILPRLIIWDGRSMYFESSEGYNFYGERIQEHITMFLQEFKEGRAKKLKVKGPTFIESLRSFIAENILYIVLVVIVAIFSAQAIWGSADKDYIGIRPRNYNGDTDRQNPSSSINDVEPTKED